MHCLDICHTCGPDSDDRKQALHRKFAFSPNLTLSPGEAQKENHLREAGKDQARNSPLPPAFVSIKAITATRLNSLNNVIIC